MMKKKLLENEIKKAAKCGMISCAVLRKIAEKSDASYKMAGSVADELQVKIKRCGLGCF